MAVLRTIGRNAARLWRLDIHFYVARPYPWLSLVIPGRTIQRYPTQRGVGRGGTMSSVTAVRIFSAQIFKRERLPFSGKGAF